MNPDWCGPRWMYVPIATGRQFANQATEHIEIFVEDRRGVSQRCIVSRRFPASIPRDCGVVAMTAAEKYVSEFADAGGVIDYTEVTP